MSPAARHTMPADVTPGAVLNTSAVSERENVVTAVHVLTLMLSMWLSAQATCNNAINRQVPSVTRHND